MEIPWKELSQGARDASVVTRPPGAFARQEGADQPPTVNEEFWSVS